ncbi:DUF1697 domain-containing protein [Tropicibacter sp. S64]|uniref:DUF1697 domain-containing protein n=1 Tax=Tropicibacter sp. S64 TaxID=3415122 RepID=UPI003C7D1CDC
MTRYCALLRAVNVGGTGKLPMAELRALCADAGFADVSTYIASGNALFATDASEDAVRAALEERLAAHAGKPVGVLIRSAARMRQALQSNPFPEADPRRLGVLFLPSEPEPAALEPKGQAGEAIVAAGREVYIHYPDGMGRSKLRFKAMDVGTMRNLNTVAKLADLLDDTGD